MAPIVPVWKRYGSVRISGDFRLTLNGASPAAQYPLLNRAGIFLVTACWNLVQYPLPSRPILQSTAGRRLQETDRNKHSCCFSQETGSEAGSLLKSAGVVVDVLLGEESWGQNVKRVLQRFM